MNDYYSLGTLKRMALKQMQGNMLVCVQTVLMSFFPVYILYFILSSAIPVFNNQALFIASDILNFFIMALLSGVLVFGRKFFFLNLATKNPYKYTDCFYGFKNYTGKVLIISLIKAFITLVLIVIPTTFLSLFTIIGATAYFPQNLMPYKGVAEYDNMIKYGTQLIEYFNLGGLSFISWSMIYFFAASITITTVIFYIWILMATEQVERLLLYYPSRSVFTLIKMSAKFMKGHKFRRFLIMLNFIPHNILSFLSFGAGFLLVVPYKEAVYTNFFLDLKAIEGKQSG